MIASGREPMCTAPLAADTMAGKLLPAAGLAAGVVGWEPPHAAQAAARTVAAARAGRRRERTRMIILRRVVEDEVRPLRRPTGIETNRPSSEDSTSAPARRPGSSPRRGHHRCGTAPASHRLRWVSAILGGPRTGVTVARPADRAPSRLVSGGAWPPALAARAARPGPSCAPGRP